MTQKIHQKKRVMSLIDTQTIQDQVDFYNLKKMIENEVQEEEHKKTEIKYDFLKNNEEIIQHKQSKYEVMLHIFFRNKKIIHQSYITSNDRYVSSEFYI